jgi:hypothetical protein
MCMAKGRVRGNTHEKREGEEVPEGAAELLLDDGSDGCVERDAALDGVLELVAGRAG